MLQLQYKVHKAERQDAVQRNLRLPRFMLSFLTFLSTKFSLHGLELFKSADNGATQ